jgi:DHA1 family bicyclomycin/chloramphenicol resistance-like MFS transporter
VPPAAPADASGRLRGPVAALLTAVVAIGSLSIDMALPSLPATAEALAARPATAQLTVTLFLAGFALAQLVHGPLSDRIGRRRVLLGGLVVYVIGGLACWAAPSAGLLVAARVLQAFGAGSGPVVGRAVVRDLYEPAQAARILGYMGTAMALTPILAPIVGGFVHVAFGWRAVYLTLAACGAVFLGIAALLVRETNRRRDPDALRPGHLTTNVAELLTDRTFLGYVLVVALMFGGQFAFITGSSFVLIEVLSVSPDVYGLCFGLVALGIMTGSFVAGRFVSRVGIDGLIVTATRLGAVAGCVMAALALGGVWTVPAVIGPMYAFSVGVGIVLPTAVAGAIGPFPRTAGLASAVLGFLQLTAAAGYGIAVGRFYDGTPVPMAVAIAAAGLAAAGAVLIGRRRGVSEG